MDYSESKMLLHWLDRDNTSWYNVFPRDDYIEFINCTIVPIVSIYK